MTPRERVLKIINHEETDFLPYNFWWEAGVREKYAEWVGDPDFDRDFVQHFVTIGAETRRTEISADEYIDECGSRFQQGNIFHLSEPALPEPSLKGFAYPDMSEEWRYKTMSDGFAADPDLFKIAWQLGAFFERGSWLRGMENWLADLVENERFVNELCDVIEEAIMIFVDIAGKRGDVDAILIGDDYGAQRGLIMGPVMWRKYFKPRLARIYERIHEHGKYVAIHSCGDNSPIMGELADIGLDIFNPFQPEAMDIIEMKRLYGDRLTFNGGIGTQGALAHGTPEDVRREVRFVARTIGKGGGLVIESTKALRPEMPPENISALIDELTNQRRN